MTPPDGADDSEMNRRRVLKTLGATAAGLVAATGSASAAWTKFFGCDRVCSGTNGTYAVVAVDDGYECRRMTESDASDVPWDWQSYCYEATAGEAVVGMVRERGDVNEGSTCTVCFNPNDCAAATYESRSAVIAGLEASCSVCGGAVREADQCKIEAEPAPSDGDGSGSGDGSGDGGGETSGDGGDGSGDGGDGTSGDGTGSGDESGSNETGSSGDGSGNESGSGQDDGSTGDAGPPDDGDQSQGADTGDQGQQQRQDGEETAKEAPPEEVEREPGPPSTYDDYEDDRDLSEMDLVDVDGDDDGPAWECEEHAENGTAMESWFDKDSTAADPTDKHTCGSGANATDAAEDDGMTAIERWFARDDTPNWPGGL